MKPFELPATMMLGYPPIDDEHLHLAALINELAALPEDASGSRIAEKVDGIFRAFESHCISEVKVLREFGYPLSDTHEAHHADQMARMKTLRERSGGETTAGQSRGDLFHETLWIFLEETIKEDLQAKSFLMELGVVKSP